MDVHTSTFTRFLSSSTKFAHSFIHEFRGWTTFSNILCIAHEFVVFSSIWSSYRSKVWHLVRSMFNWCAVRVPEGFLLSVFDSFSGWNSALSQNLYFVENIIIIEHIFEIWAASIGIFPRTNVLAPKIMHCHPTTLSQFHRCLNRRRQIKTEDTYLR